MPLPTVHVLYENPAWLPPLIDALEAEGFPHRLVELDEGCFDPTAVPEPGIWWNRISPSSHTRGHTGSVALAREVLFWLESWGRTVINGSRAFEVEVSKFRQDLLLRKHGILTPKTVLARGDAALVEAARAFDGPFITKHNRGGKGLGILLFESVAQLEVALENGALEEGPDDAFILQEYIVPKEPYITRVEIVGDRLLYAMRSATDDGFQLCPSDACQVPAAAPDVCPIDGVPLTTSGRPKFTTSPLTRLDPLVQRYIRLMRAEGIDLAGIEFVEDARGNRYTYDINGTTNYSGTFGRTIGVDGMREVVRGFRALAAKATAA